MVSRCRECSNKPLHFSLARAGGIYTGTLKEAIHQLKYDNGKALAPHLARFTSERILDLAHRAESIAFVPLTRRKEAARGYDQSRLIARELASLLQLPLFNGLEKAGDIPEQNKLGLTERPGNVRGAFVVREQCAGTILLVDDVYTTGSTVNECARVLRAAGASEVLVVTVARTPLTGR